MDISDLLKQGNMGNISPEKLNFLMQFANQNHSGNAKKWHPSFRRLLLPQKRKGLNFPKTNGI